MITSKEMHMLESQSGIPISVLMENAGKAIARVIKEKFDIKNLNVLIICYHGNNGGDGFVAARYLCDECEVDILFLGDEEKLKKEPLAHYKKVEENVKIQFVDVEIDFDDYDIIVDAIFGTGFNGKLGEPIRGVIDTINKAKAKKVSIDVPSGMDPDTGEVPDITVDADLIIALHDIKKGIMAFENKTVIVNIGLPKKEESEDGFS